MTAEYYSNLFKQFSTFIPADYKILSGGTSDDLDWTETIMKNTRNYSHLIQGYSYHYYTICQNWTVKGSATDFTAGEWFNTMKKTLYVDANLSQHSTIMDRYDPEKKIAIIADEWGNWFDAEPGLNQSLLYQQNTLRDAVTAGLYLNIFNNHSDRVKMANIAQMVNVLQSVILTNNETIIKTPTFYVFKMYKVHQDATLLPVELQCADYGNGTEKIPALSISASSDKDGNIHISIVNLDPEVAHKLRCEIRGRSVSQISGDIITADSMNALNDFGVPEQVAIMPFSKMRLKDNIIHVDLPAKSVVMIELK